MQYCTNSDLQNWIRSLWALSLVPVEDVVMIWETVVMKNVPVDQDEDSEDEEESEAAADLRQRIMAFIAYFEATWIGPISTRNKTRKSAKFPPILWNKFEETLCLEDTNTNRSEGTEL